MLQVGLYWLGLYIAAYLLDHFQVFSPATMRFAILALPLLQTTVVATLVTWANNSSPVSAFIPVAAMYGLVIMLVLNPAYAGYFYGIVLPEAYFLMLAIVVMKADL